MIGGRRGFGRRCVTFTMLASLLGAAAPLVAAPSPAAKPEATPAAEVIRLYDAGDYTGARGLARRLIEDHEAGRILIPPAEMASIYVMAACLADIFHDQGFADEVDRALAGALALDPNVDAGPAADRPLVRKALADARKAYLAANGPATRRFSAGLSLAVAGPASLRWPDTVLPGIGIGFAPIPWLDVEGEALMPVAGWPPAGVELRLGAAVRPFFLLARVLPVFGMSYVASSGATWTHGLGLWVGAEVAIPRGWWFRGSAELARIDLGQAPPEGPGSYPAITGDGVAAAFSFPRLSLSAAYSF